MMEVMYHPAAEQLSLSRDHWQQIPLAWVQLATGRTAVEGSHKMVNPCTLYVADHSTGARIHLTQDGKEDGCDPGFCSSTCPHTSGHFCKGSANIYIDRGFGALGDPLAGLWNWLQMLTTKERFDGGRAKAADFDDRWETEVLVSAMPGTTPRASKAVVNRADVALLVDVDYEDGAPHVSNMINEASTFMRRTRWFFRYGPASGTTHEDQKVSG